MNPCPECQRPALPTQIPHSTFGPIAYPPCEDCTFTRLQQTAQHGGFVMSNYAKAADLHRERYAFLYLSHLRGMKYRLREEPPGSNSYLMTRRGELTSHRPDNAHYEFWMKLDDLLEQLYTATYLD